MLVGLQSRANPFRRRPTYQALASLPLPERVARLRDPEVRARILAERPIAAPDDRARSRRCFGPAMYARLFPLGEPPDYEPAADASVAAIAEREGRPADAVLYDLMLGHDGRELLLLPAAQLRAAAAPSRFAR